MPFTFAHPLYAAPLKWVNKRFFVLSGLVLGSMSPDFEYFIALEPYQWIGHTHAGLLLEALPLCLIIIFLLHYIVKKTLAAHLPGAWRLDERASLRMREICTAPRSFREYLLFSVSVMFGFYSHIFIDSFTHYSGYFVERIPVLRAVILHIPIYKWLQHSLSVLGLSACVTALWYGLKTVALPQKRQRDKVKSRKNKWLYWIATGIVMLAVILLKLLCTDSTNWLGIIVVAPISGLAAGIVAASFVFRGKRSSLQ